MRALCQEIWNPTTTTIYTLTATNSAGSVPASTTVTFNPNPSQKLRVLFIGNSLTNVNDLPNTFHQLAETMGVDLDVVSSMPGDAALESHADPNNNVGKTTCDLIDHRGPWDYVVLQENPEIARWENQYSRMKTAAAALKARVLTSSPSAKIVFYMTFTYGIPNMDANGRYTTMDWITQSLLNAYSKASSEVGGILMPGGIAFMKAVYARPGICPYLDTDTLHPTSLTTYMMACGFIGAILHKNPEDLSEYLQLTSDQAGLAQTCAREALAEHNIPVPARTRVVPPPIQPEVDANGWSKIDNRDLRVGWSFQWHNDNVEDTAAYQGRYVSSDVKNEKAWFSFQGTKVRYYGRKGANSCIVDIYIDDVLQGPVDCYAANASFGMLFESVVLPPGNHTLTVVITGNKNASSSGAYMAIDAFSYLAAP